MQVYRFAVLDNEAPIEELEVALADDDDTLAFCQGVARAPRQVEPPPGTAVAVIKDECVVQSIPSNDGCPPPTRVKAFSRAPTG